MNLKPDQTETLRALGRSVCRGSDQAYVLEQYGLAHTGKGRYGTYARLSEAGAALLASLPPVVAPGSGDRASQGVQPLPGTSLRGAAPRDHRTAAKKRTRFT